MWNSLKQDLLNKHTLQSEDRQIGSNNFFYNEQAARRLWCIGKRYVAFFNFHLTPLIFT